MAKGDLVKPRKIVKANNDLFRCNYKIKDIVAGRIFMAFASLVDHRDVKENQSFVEYKIDATSIIRDIDAGGDYYEQLRNAARALVGHKIEQHKHGKHFVLYTLFSKIEYENGILTGEFHKDLMPFFIIAKDKFTKMPFNEYMELPSIYSQCIFAFLKSWYDKQEITVKLSELHIMLDTPASVKANFAEFKRRVLDKAHKDINEKTNLSFEYEAIKTGRAVSEIKFKFMPKPTPINCQNAKMLEDKPSGASAMAYCRNFIDKFPDDTNVSILIIAKLWLELHSMGIAPMAEDVPENNSLRIMEFLEQWKNNHIGQSEKPADSF